MTNTAHLDLGRQGEKIASYYLQNKGYTILEKNLRIGKQEIDIIAEKDNEIIFVEVKTRSNNSHGEPEDSIDKKKEENLQKASDAYMLYYELDLAYRIDIIAILLKGEKSSINHIEDALW